MLEVWFMNNHYRMHYSSLIYLVNQGLQLCGTPCMHLSRLWLYVQAAFLLITTE